MAKLASEIVCGVIGGETFDSLTLELLKARREADRRLARAITEFEQITRNEREEVRGC